MRRFDDPEFAIRVDAGEAFLVSLTGNPTTGYTWHVQVDTDYLELLDRKFEPEAPAVGAGGRELFQFQSHQTGETKIAFEYRRPWGGQTRSRQEIQVLIA